MKSNIAEMLADFSKESAELDDVTKVEGEEVTEFLDDVADEIEDEIEAGVEIQEEGVSVENAIDAMFDATWSLESSVEHLESMYQQGDVSETAIRIFNQSIVHSMEARGIPAHVFGDDITFSFEADDKAPEAKVGFFTKIWNMIKAAFRRMREWVTRFLGWFRTSGAAVRKAAEKLKKLAEEKSKNNAKVAEGAVFQSAPFNDLMVGAKLDPIDAVDSLISGVTTVFSSAGAILTESQKAADAMASAPPSGFSGAIKRVLGIKENIARELKRVANNPAVEKLPGGRELKIEVIPGKRGMKASIKVVKTEKTKAPTDTSPVMALKDIITLANQITSLVNNTEKALESFDKQYQATKAMDTKTIKVDDARDRTEVSEVTSLITQGSVLAKKLTSEISGIVFPIAKRAYVYGMVNVRKYK